MYRFALLTLFLLSSPIMLRWNFYQDNALPASRLVLSRAVNGGAFTALATLGLQQVSLMDTQTKKHRTYCYRLHAETATGIASPFSTIACARTP